MLTSKQVLEASGFKSVKTLQRWRERNLVPPPTLQRHPTGRGMTWMWPTWTIRHIDGIKKRNAAGESLDDIARTFSSDWQVEAQKYHRKRYDFKEACDRMELYDAIERFGEWVSDYVYQFLRDIGVERPGRIDNKIWKAVSKRQFVNDTRELLLQGCSPVMIVTKADVTVAADFVLGSVFGNSEVEAQPILIVPIRSAFIDAFAKAEPTLPKESSLTPVMQVIECSEKKPRIRRYRRRGKWGFTLEK